MALRPWNILDFGRRLAAELIFELDDIMETFIRVLPAAVRDSGGVTVAERRVYRGAAGAAEIRASVAA